MSGGIPLACGAGVRGRGGWFTGGAVDPAPGSGDIPDGGNWRGRLLFLPIFLVPPPPFTPTTPPKPLTPPTVEPEVLGRGRRVASPVGVGAKVESWSNVPSRGSGCHDGWEHEYPHRIKKSTLFYPNKAEIIPSVEKEAGRGGSIMKEG